MKRPSLNWVGIRIGLWVYVGAGAIALALTLNDDRISAIIAGVVFGGVFAFSRHVLHFPIFSVPMLYLGMLGLFHLGLAVPWALGFYDAQDVWWFGRTELTPALALVTLALVSLQIGTIWGTRDSSRVVRNDRPIDRAEKPGAERTLFWAGIGILGLGSALYIVGQAIVFGKDLFRVTYLDLYGIVQGADSRWLGVGGFLLPVGIYTSAVGASRKQMIALLPLLGLWCFWNLFLGFRGTALIVGLVFLYLLIKRGYKIPVPLQLALLAFVLYAIPVVKAVRNELMSQRSYTVSLGSEAHPLEGIAEMGGSIWPLAETYRLVTSSDLSFGKTYVQAFGMVFPENPLTYKPGQRMVRLEADPRSSPARWFVWTVDPAYARRGGGYGFSSVGEAYINFGFVGVFLFFLGLGFAMVWMERAANRNLFALTAVAVVLAPLLWTVRNDFSVFTRPAVWGLAFVGVVWWLSSGLKKVRGRTSAMEGVTPSLVAGSPQHSRSARGPAGVASGGGLCTRR